MPLIIIPGKQYKELATNDLFRCQSVNLHTDTAVLMRENNLDTKRVQLDKFFETFKKA